MIGKLLLIAVVIAIVYFVFFKSKPAKNIDKKNSNNKEEETLIQCPTCSTYMSTKSAFISNGKFFCSEKCGVS
jgi:uncharacterized protein